MTITCMKKDWRKTKKSVYVDFFSTQQQSVFFLFRVSIIVDFVLASSRESKQGKVETKVEKADGSFVRFL